MSLVFDLMLVGLILYMVLKGRKRGFVKSSYTILSIVITIILMMTLEQPILEYLNKSPVGNAVRERIEIKVKENADTEDPISGENTDKIADGMKLPDIFSDFLSDSIKKGTDAVETVKNDFVKTLSDAITEAVLKIASFIILLILVQILTYLVLNALNIVMKLPVLSCINGMLGMIMGAVNGLLLVYIICAGLTLLAPTETLSSIGGIVDKTLFVRYFYNNNILMGLFI